MMVASSNLRGEAVEIVMLLGAILRESDLTASDNQRGGRHFDRRVGRADVNFQPDKGFSSSLALVAESSRSYAVAEFSPMRVRPSAP
jgi:hypothetical protein